MRFRNIILTTMIAIIAGMILFFGIFSVNQYERSLTNRVIDDYQESVGIMGSNVAALIMYMEDFSKSTSLDDFVVNSIVEYQSREDRRSVQNIANLRNNWDVFSNKLIYSTTMIYNVDLFSDRELIYSYHDLQWDAQNSVIPKEILDRAFNQAPPIWTDLISLRQLRKYNKNDEYGFAVVKSVRNAAARTIGCIAIYVKESSFASLIDPMNHEDQRCFLVNGSQRVVSAGDKETLSKSIGDVLDLNSDEYEECTKEGTLLKKTPGRVPALYITRNVKDSDLRLICEIRMTDLVSQTGKTRMILLMIGLVSVSLALVSVGIATRRITQPLEKLLLVMKGIESDNGKSQIRFQEKYSGDIGILGEQFNDLMDQLDASREQVIQEQRQLWHNEVKLLQAQIVPHFLYNTLGMISSMIRLDMKEEAVEAVQKLAAFYRLSLSNGREIIPIREEVELTLSYMALQQLRYIEYMEYSIDYDDQVDDILIPKLTLQPLVENVLHHGLRNDGRKCNIRIRIAADPDHEGVLIRVWDDGVGMSEERLRELRKSLETNPDENSSFGISNIHQRLKMFYGEDFHMEINSEEDCFTEFLLYLPAADKQNFGKAAAEEALI